MRNTMEMDITEHEERLRLAMIESDVKMLHNLLAPDLIFTNHLGQTMTKEDDLSAHKSGILKIEILTLSNSETRTIGDIAIVTAQAHLMGSYAGEQFENYFRFTRVWTPSSKNSWQVIVAHSCIVI